MHSLCHKTLAFFWLVLPPVTIGQTLRVCADPNNMPFSNAQEQGFENKLASLIAASLNAHLEYVWTAQRKSFATNSLGAGVCDLILGVPDALPGVLATAPYYRSTYVFLSRRDRNLHITSLDDPRLANLRIGVHITGDDYAPPAYALAHRGITGNIKGFSLYGDPGEADPPRKLIDAVDQGGIDVAIAWGPLAGFFAKGSRNALDLEPVRPQAFLGIPFVFDISAAVRPGNAVLKERLDRILESQAAAVRLILTGFGVPQVLNKRPV